MDGITAYHQLHMPSNNAVRYAIQNIRQIDPQPRILAPLYGNLVRGQEVVAVLDKLYNLAVGSDLLYSAKTPERSSLYMEAANDVLKEATELFSKDKVLRKIREDEHLNTLCQFKESEMTMISQQPARTLEHLITVLVENEAEDLSNQIKSVALKSVVAKKLPPISLGRDTTESMVKIPKKIFKN